MPKERPGCCDVGIKARDGARRWCCFHFRSQEGFQFATHGGSGELCSRWAGMEHARSQTERCKGSIPSVWLEFFVIFWDFCLVMHRACATFINFDPSISCFAGTPASQQLGLRPNDLCRQCARGTALCFVQMAFASLAQTFGS